MSVESAKKKSKSTTPTSAKHSSAERFSMMTSRQSPESSLDGEQNRRMQTGGYSCITLVFNICERYSHTRTVPALPTIHTRRHTNKHALSLSLSLPLSPSLSTSLSFSPFFQRKGVAQPRAMRGKENTRTRNAVTRLSRCEKEGQRHTSRQKEPRWPPSEPTPQGKARLVEEGTVAVPTPCTPSTCLSSARENEVTELA